MLTFRTQSLGEITVAIEETDSGHIYVAIRCLFDIVARQDTQTTRVDLQHVGQTILHREICDSRFFLVFRRVHVSAELIVNLVQFLHELRILAQLYHAVVTQDVHQNNRVRVCAMPCLGVDVAEQILCIRVPTPPYIVRQFLQFTQLCRKRRVNVALRPGRLIYMTYFYFHISILFVIFHYFPKTGRKITLFF